MPTPSGTPFEQLPVISFQRSVVQASVDRAWLNPIPAAFEPVFAVQVVATEGRKPEEIAAINRAVRVARVGITNTLGDFGIDWRRHPGSVPSATNGDEHYWELVSLDPSELGTRTVDTIASTVGTNLRRLSEALRSPDASDRTAQFWPQLGRVSLVDELPPEYYRGGW